MGGLSSTRRHFTNADGTLRTGVPRFPQFLPHGRADLWSASFSIWSFKAARSAALPWAVKTPQFFASGCGSNARIDPTGAIIDPTMSAIYATRNRIDAPAPILDPTGSRIDPTEAILDPTATIIDPTWPRTGPTGAILHPTGAITEPTWPMTDATWTRIHPTESAMDATGIITDPTEEVFSGPRGCGRVGRTCAHPAPAGPASPSRRSGRRAAFRSSG